MKIPVQQNPTILSILNFLERASYYGFQSFFIFYFIQTRNVDQIEGYTLFGLFYGLIFLITSFSGYIINKAVNPLFLYKVCFCLAPIGVVLFLNQNQLVHLIGMSMMIFATSFFRVIVPLLIGEFCDFRKEVDRNALFRKLYIHMNIGVFIAPILTGVLSLYYGWIGAIFLIALLYLVGAYIICFYGSRIFVDKRDSQRSFSSIKGLSLIVLSHFLILFFLYNEGYYNYLFIFVIFITLFVLVFFYLRSSALERTGLNLIHSMILFFFLFVGFYEQHGSSINMFVMQHIDRNFFGFEIPANFFQSISPLILVFCGAYVNKIFASKKMKTVNSNVFLKIMIAYSLFAIAYFFFFKMAFNVTLGRFGSTSSLILGLFFIAMGEIIFFPVVSSFITKFSPKNLKTTYLSLMNITASSSMFLTSILSKLTAVDLNGNNQVYDSYSQVFGLVMVACILLACLSFIVSRTQLKT